MIKQEVSCVQVSDTTSRVVAIGGLNSRGQPWSLRVQEAVEGMRLRRHSFFARLGGVATDILVVHEDGDQNLALRGVHEKLGLADHLPRCRQVTWKAK